MTSAVHSVPVSGLSHLTNETRMIATPWSRMVRGIGLGQYPVAYDPDAAERIRRTFALLTAKGLESDAYTRFSRLLADFVLAAADPERSLSRPDLAAGLAPVLAAVRAQRNPYFRLMAGCILMDAFAKLGLDTGLLITPETDFPAEILAVADSIEPDQIKDENAGRHGQYEKLSAYSAVFLALGQLGLQERLVTGARNYVREALALLEQIPAPFFRGRGGAVLLSVTCLIGYERFIRDEGRDHVKEVLDHLDRADELDAAPAFPQPMSESFPKIYPLLTMLNAIAMSSRPQEYLMYGRDRLAEARELMQRITPVERTHMGLYYIIALHNLDRLDEQVPQRDALIEDIVGAWAHIDPGANYFLNGIAYAYIIQTAMLTGRMDLIGDDVLDRLVDCFPDLNRTDDDRVNRPYPFAYTLNVLGEIGCSQLLFEPRDAYDGATPVAWVVDQLSEGGREEPRLYMLNHALIGYALRMRGPARNETPLTRGFRFGRTSERVV
ncbi:hypothetical protein [Streptomyces sp. NPDC048361]|uniref:hypothetical protein n=1 Tax=Streptomyces sp. NPDC048361 TaxID=3154720 RepID=UPI0034473F44